MSATLPTAATAASHPRSLAYRADVDGLRAVAVMLVLVFHFNLFGSGKAGFIGVDVFFVISGYLITSIIRRQLDLGHFALGTFYVNRIRRLAPPLFLVLALTFAAGVLLLFPNNLNELARQVLSSQLYVANVYYWQNINYFNLRADNVWLLHTWSLAVEEQFYLLYPLGLLLVHRYARRFFWPAIAACLVLSFALNLHFVKTKPELTFYLLPTRAWELLAGALLPWVATRLRGGRLTAELLGLAGIVFIALGIALYGPEVKFPGYFALLPVLGACCLILAGEQDQRQGSVSRFLAAAPVVYIGQISYSLYLVHWPINVFAKHLLEDDYSFAWRFSMFLLSIALAALIYIVAEKPFRNRTVLKTTRPLLGTYAAGLMATVLACVAIQATAGWPSRFPADAMRFAAYEKDRPPELPACEFSGQPIPLDRPECRLGDRKATPTWLVFGDSHAWAARAAFDKWLAQKGEAGVFMFRNSCPPLLGVHLWQDVRGNCFGLNQSVEKLLSEQAGLKNVVLVSTWRQAIESALTDTPGKPLTEAESVALFQSRFDATVTRLRALDKRIHIWEPVPGARGESVPLDLAKAAMGKGTASELELLRSEYQSTYGFFFEALARQRAQIAATFSPSAALCGTGRCRVLTPEGVPLYFDNAHITASTVDFWVQQVLSQPAPASAPPP